MNAAPWQALMPSAWIEAGFSIAAAQVRGKELVVWRSPDGQVQVWDDRCPHRSVRFSLGQVVGDRLSCAYHGWQFQAGDGRCAGIPAHPQMLPPREACARTWPALEAAGMIWVRLDDADVPPPGDDALPGSWHFCRSLALARPVATLLPSLSRLGWHACAPAAWASPDDHLRAFALEAGLDWCMLHVWTRATAGSAAMQRDHADLRALRTAIETSGQEH